VREEEQRDVEAASCVNPPEIGDIGE